MKVYSVGILILLFFLLAPVLSHNHHREKPIEEQKPITPEQMAAYINSLQNNPIFILGVIGIPFIMLFMFYPILGYQQSLFLTFIFSGIESMQGLQWAKISMGSLIILITFHFIKKPKQEEIKEVKAA